MSCNGCSNKNCRGCKDIKVVLPEQFGLDPDTPVVDNGDGTITINFNDGTSFTYSTAGTVPEDDWVHIDENSSVVANIDFATAGPDPNVFTFDMVYKILSASHAVVKVKALYDVTTNGPNTTMGFRIFLEDIPGTSSNWLNDANNYRLQTVLPTPAVPESVGYGNPVTYIPVGGTDLGSLPSVGAYDIHGRAGVTNNVVGAQSMYPEIQNGNYVFLIEFEVIVGIETV